MKRHGPQVLEVCRRGLPSEHDVEDVFQATFFVLAHKAAAVSWNESVESWLCAVARRLVLHARASAWQRQSRQRPITALVGRIPQAATVSRRLGDDSGQRVWFPVATADRIALLPR
ncbi:MAG: RNA polymerase sigma factor [Isosphaeraceae bacterium]